MNPHDPPARPVLRRDVLGIGALFPAGASAVPLSDFDGGATFGEAPGTDAQASPCHSCHERCPSETLLRLRIRDCDTGRTT